MKSGPTAGPARGGITLKTIVPPIALAALLVAAPIGVADATLHYDDPLGDETALFGAGSLLDDILALQLDCAARAADILALDVEAFEGNLTLRLTMDALNDLESRCAYLQLDGAEARYSVILAQPTDDLTGFPPIELRARAATTGFGLEPCVDIIFADSGPSACIGTFERADSTLVWTLPTSGDVTVEVSDDPLLGLLTHSETRSYDLRGIPLGLDASTTVAFEGMTSFASVRDYLDGDEVTL